MRIKNKKAFIDLLYELVVMQKYSVFQAFEIMTKSKNKVISNTGFFILEKLEVGESLSSAMVLCPFMKFDSSMVSFFLFSEKSGKLEDVLIFLEDKCKREEENLSLFLQAIVYPLFVIFILIVFLIFLFIYGKGLFDFTELTSIDLGKLIIEGLVRGVKVSSVFVVLFISGCISFFRNVFCNNELAEAFMAAGFLCNSGLSLSTSVGISSQLLKLKNKGNLFITAQRFLSEGNKVNEAFYKATQNCKKTLNKTTINEIEKVILLAQSKFGEQVIFEKIGRALGKLNEEKRKIYLRLMEPAFISVTGIVILIFLLNVLQPVLMNLI